MRPFIKQFFRLLLFVLVLQPSDSFCAKKRNGPVYAAIVVDDYTGTVLHKTNINARTYPASLTKVMTVYLLFEALKNKKVTLNTKMKVSKHASRQRPSKLWLKPGSTLRVRDALLALTVKSANDVAAVVAEHLGRGSEKKFAQLLTKKARALGMKNTIFKNASGLPNRRQITTARDMLTMFRALQRHFPSYYRYFKHKQFTFRGHKYRAHTRLLGRCHGVDGVKTGFINASGFNLVTSAKRQNTRIFAVVMGGKTGRWRDKRIENLINKYFPRAIALNKKRKNVQKKNNMLWARNFTPPHKPLRVKTTILAKSTNAPKANDKLLLQPDILIADLSTKQPILVVDNFDTGEFDDIEEKIIDTNNTDDFQPIEGLPSRHDAALLNNIIKNESYDDLDAVKQLDRTWAAQFGAFAKESDARDKADLLITLIPNLPGKVTVTPAKHRRTPLYRARLVNINKEQAENICKKMRFHEIPCLPLKN